MLSERLPCERSNAVEALVLLEKWLRIRSYLFMSMGLLLQLLLLYVAIRGDALGLMALAGIILLGAVILWVVHGNARLARDAARLRRDLERGFAQLDKICELPLVVAIVAYAHKRGNTVGRRVAAAAG